MNLDDGAVLRLVRVLGYGGLLPFVVLSGLAIAMPQGAAGFQPGVVLQWYGAAIASFIGALWWGPALGQPSLAPRLRKALLYAGVVPSLLATLALMVGGVLCNVLLAAVLLAAWRVDVLLAEPLAYPHAWRSLRRDLSLVALCSLLLPVVLS